MAKRKFVPPFKVGDKIKFHAHRIVRGNPVIGKVTGKLPTNQDDTFEVILDTFNVMRSFKFSQCSEFEILK